MKQQEMSAKEFQRLHGQGSTKQHQKYGSKVASADGHKFHSRKEAKRYGELVLLQRLGKIAGLRMQVPFGLYAGTITSPKAEAIAVAKYIADFVYITVPGGERVIEDVKGFRTPLYKLKKKFVETCHGVTITEI